MPAAKLDIPQVTPSDDSGTSHYQSGLHPLEALARAARQTALYGPDHPLASTAVRTAWQELLAATARGQADVAVEETSLHWNGGASPANPHVQQLHRTLRERMVAGITFTDQLHAGDLARLLQLLAEDPQLLLAAGGVMQAFGPGGARGLLLRDVDFARDLRDCEAAWVEECRKIDPQAVEPIRRILETCLHLVRSVGEHKTLEEVRAAAAKPMPFDSEDLASPTEAVAGLIAGLIQSAGEISMRTGSGNFQAWQSSVLLQLEGLGTYWSAFVLRAPAPPSEGSHDVFAFLTDRMSLERRISLVLDYPGSIVAERSEGLALILRRLLARSKESFVLERTLHERALARGVPEPVYRNVVSLLLPDVARRHTDSVPRVVETLPTAPGGLAEDLSDLFASLEAPAMRRTRAAMLLDFLCADLEASHYSFVVRALVESVAQSTGAQEAGTVIRVLEHLAEELTKLGPRNPGRRAVLEGALHRCATTEVIALLLAEIPRRPSSQRGAVITLLGWLGEPGLKALSDLARNSYQNDSQEVLSVLADRDAPDFHHLRQLLGELPVLELEPALRTLLHLSHPALSTQIGALAVHLSPHVRRTLLRVVSDTGSRPGAQVVVRLLSDPLPELRAAAAALLGRLRFSDAAPGICYLLRRESDFGAGARVKQAAACALGEIGSPEAVPPLAEVLLGGGLLARLAPTGPRMAVVEALRRIGTPDARRVLQDWRRCPQPSVRVLCRVALSNLATLAPIGLKEPQSVG